MLLGLWVALRIFSVHQIVTAVSCHWGNFEEDPANKTDRPWPVTHRTQTNTLSRFIACVDKDSSVSYGKLKRLCKLKRGIHVYCGRLSS